MNLLAQSVRIPPKILRQLPLFRQALNPVVCFAVLGLLLVQGVGVSQAQAELPEQAACTFTIPNEVSKIDGKKNYAEVKPGDILCLPAGTRGNLKLTNLHGAPGLPITIRNEGGRVIITGSDFLTGGIGITKSSYLRVTGTGVTSKCGALFSAEEQECGIDIDRTHKGIKINTHNGLVHHLEIDHVSVHDTSTTIGTRGITIHPLEEQVITGVYIHHNHVYNTSAEGIYLGTEPKGRPLDVLGKLEDVEVSYNRVEQIGFDGIKIKVAVRDVKVHHNYVRDVGLKQTPAHQGGIKLAYTVGDFYNNYIANVFEGIRIGRTLDGPGARYFNNIIIAAESVGIGAPEHNAQVFNNTIVNSEQVGINAPGKNALVFDNIVVGTAGTPIQAMPENIFNNLIGPVTLAGFINPDEGDYQLKPQSLAVDAGRKIGRFPSIDFANNRRPQGLRTDLGAYELPREQLLTLQNGKTSALFFPQVHSNSSPSVFQYVLAHLVGE